MPNKFYPPLSTLITPAQIPESLSFISSGINSLLEKIYYRDLKIQRSSSSATISYNLDIITFSELLKLEIPGTGLVLTLNSNLENPNDDINVIPLSFTWHWGIQQYIRNFKLTNFSFSSNDFYKLIFDLVNVSDLDLLLSTTSLLIETANPLDTFVQAANTKYPTLNIPYPLNTDNDIAINDTLTALAQNTTVSLQEIVFVDYVIDETSIENTLQNINFLFFPTLGANIIDSIKELLIPQVTATAQLSAGLEIPRKVLIPINANGEIETDEAIKTTLLFNIGEFRFDSKAGFGFNDNIVISFPAAHPKAQIANTGLIISFTEAKLDLSRTTNIPEADLAGYPLDFVGLYVQTAEITFSRFGITDPTKPSTTLFAENLLIGTGGISGTIGLAANGTLYRKFGTNFDAELKLFSLTFRQGTITQCNIEGLLTIPKFKNGNGSTENAKIGIQARIFDNGDFSITAKPLLTPYIISFPNVFDLKVRSLEVGKLNDSYYAEVSGVLDFTANVPLLGEVLPKQIEIHRLRIWDDGHLEFAAGRIKLQKAFKLEVGPVKLEVVELSLAPYKKGNRTYSSITFDGMINTGRAGVNVGGNGIKYYFNTDVHPDGFDHFIRIEGIDIDIRVPGDKTKDANFLLKGHLSMKNPEVEGVDEQGKPLSQASTEYAGSVTFDIPKLDFGGSAGMRLNPSIPAFLVDMNIELATPVPIGATGLGIYGFRGLFGQHYVPNKADDSSWLEYYRAPTKGVNIDKFASKPGLSLGAGASIATSFDSGKTFSSKLFLLLGLPDVFLLEGQAAILRKRLGIDDDVEPPFTALIIIGDQAIRANLAVDYKIPDSGSILDLHGELDMAFFFNNSSGWYLNIGKDAPETARIRTQVLSLFNGYAYFMISAQGIKAGAGARFDFNKRFGPVSVGCGAFLNLGGFINFRPFQIGGFIQLGGYAYIRVWRWGFEISVQAGLAVEAPHPFNIVGSVEISFRIIRRFRIGLEFSWRISGDDSPLRVPIPVLNLPNPAKGIIPAKATHILTQETFTLNYVNAITSTIPAPNDFSDGKWKVDFTKPETTIPLDCFIDIELQKPVLPGIVPLGGASNQVPTGYKELMPPIRGYSDQIEHQFRLENLEIFAWVPTSAAAGNWVSYNIYEAVTSIVNSNNNATAPVILSNLKQGYWQFVEPGRFNKIRLLAQNMFSFSSKTINGADNLDARNFKPKDVFCYDTVLKKNIINWEKETVDTVYPLTEAISFSGVSFTFSGTAGQVKSIPSSIPPSLTKNLYLQENSFISLVFPEPVNKIELTFGANQSNVTVLYYTTNFKVSDYGEVISYDYLIRQDNINPIQQNAKLNYLDGEDGIDKIVIAINSQPDLDYEGDVQLGGYYPIANGFEIPDNIYPYIEVAKTLLYITFYNRSFTLPQVLAKNTLTETGIVAQFAMDSQQALVGNITAQINGRPLKKENYYQDDTNSVLQLNKAYQFTGKNNALFIPYQDSLKIENASFAVELTAVFKVDSGISTLLTKVVDGQTEGYRKGFSLHLIQNAASQTNTTFTTLAAIPTFTILLTIYSGFNTVFVTAFDKYTLDCNTNKFSAKQYKNILVSVNRNSNILEIFIDGISKSQTAIPSALAVFSPQPKFTYLNQITYFTAEQQKRITESPLTNQQLANEVAILDAGINKIVQPLWRPNTTYAIRITTSDTVQGINKASTQIFGFKTAGPIGHFHLQNPQYIALKAQDREGEFKLANLREYIDFERSYPDAQGRYELSKPPFYIAPKIKLFFTQPYINAMFANWDNYLNLTPLSSELVVQLIAQNGTTIAQNLKWENPIEEIINDDNIDNFPEDLKTIYWLNKNLTQGACNPVSSDMKKRIQNGSYTFPDLVPNTMYTAVFNATYGVGNATPQAVEVHKYNFKTSIFASFATQASSFILNATSGQEKYDIYTKNIAITQSIINSQIKPIINEVTGINTANASQYTAKFDRLIYGGFSLNILENAPNTVITVLINTTTTKCLGLLISNPEPFNDPKIPTNLLDDTIKLTLTLANNTVIPPSSFIYIHSADTSAVFITNAAMDIPLGKIKLDFTYKLFNGFNYTTLFETYSTPELNLLQ